ncbi:AAA family ATPase [Sediminitomix flava]|uniref:Signal transduction histidine kinase n=1 Tax=Sediminitomix flava TaxID=379075 RepID=A0A315Z9C9_SEDFL|nr:AAA family ATPase [Sediminitomix flava]PWJ40804.1 signal transduction histidine kinase [Sediminitomix flava]
MEVLPTNFYRSEELDLLKSYYDSFLDEESRRLKTILLEGEVGSGKTDLLNRFFEHISYTSKYVSVCSAEYYNVPYYPFREIIASAINDLVVQLDQNERQHLSDQLFETIGLGFFILEEYIPELSLLVENAPLQKKKTIQVLLENRLPYLFLEMCKLILSYINGPIFLFFEDVQYMDQSSLYLLRYLLKELKDFPLFIALVYDTHGGDEFSEFRIFTSDLTFENSEIPLVSIEPLSEEVSEQIIQDELKEGYCGKKLSRLIFEESKGNLHALVSVVHNLQVGNGIWLEDGVWHADSLSFHSLIEKKYKEEQWDLIWNSLSEQDRLLMTALTLRKTVSLKDIRGILDDIPTEEIEDCLGDWLQLQIIKKDKNQILFKELSIAEFFSSKIEPEAYFGMAYRLGQYYISKYKKKENFQDLTLAVRYLGKASANLTNENDLIEVIQYQCVIAEKSKQNQEYQTAIDYYNLAIELLGELSRDSKKEFQFDIVLQKAICEYYLGNYELADQLLDNLFEHSHTLHQRIRIFREKISINTHIGRLQKAKELVKYALLELGVKIEENLGTLKEKLKQDEKNLPVRIHERLLNQHTESRKMTPREHSILEILYIGGISLNYASNDLMKWQSLKILRIGLQSEFSKYTSLALVTYGRLLMAEPDKMEMGFQIGETGIYLNQKIGSNTLHTRVMGVYAFYIHFWKKNFHTALPFLERGIENYKENGDLYGKFILQTHHFNIHFLMGENLDILERKSKELLQAKSESFTSYILDCHIALIAFLKGKKTDISLLKSEVPNLVNSYSEEENFYRNYAEGKAAFLLGEYHRAAEFFELAIGRAVLHLSSPLYPEVIFYEFMAVSYLYRKGENRVELLLRLHKALEHYKKWTAFNPNMFKIRYCLMKTVLEWVTDRSEADELPYIENIWKEIDQPVEQVLITTFLMRKALEEQKLDEAKAYYKETLNFYERWGAVAVVQFFRQQYNFLNEDRDIFPPENLSILFQSRLIVGLDLDQVLQNLLLLSMNSAAADRISILLQKNGATYELGRANLLDFSIQTFGKKRPLQKEDFDITALQYSIRTNRSVFASYETLKNNQRPMVKSLSCIPARTIDGNVLIAYFENTFETNVFRESVVSAFEGFTRQAVLSLSNALIHTSLLNVNKELNKQIIEKDELHKLMDTQKSEYMARVIQAQEKERLRIAQDLHDSVGGLLSATRMSLQHTMEALPEERQDDGSKVISLLDKTVGEVRQISHHMMPPVLKRFGFLAALQDLVETLNTSTNLDISLSIWGDDTFLDVDDRVNLYRICQEILQNIIKYAKAESILIQFTAHASDLNMIIEDDGIGFDYENVQKGMGFENINFRVEMLKGNFHVESILGKGSSFIIEIPLVTK